MIPRALSALAVLFLFAACGGAGGEEGTAQLWVTRDRGAELLVDVRVDAGQTLMRTLASEVDLKTRYGGRYVQSVNGLEGSLRQQRDWFWFVNGYEGDRSAASYKLRDGDVAWFDYRRWQREGEARVVVGAFPEPLLHGYAGHSRPVAIRYQPAAARRARELALRFPGADLQALPAPAPAGSNVLEVRAGPPRLTGELLGQTAGDPVRFVLSGSPAFERRFSVR
ncbi:MAG TPA: DUF4430 domain-containing protein [Gaiellaceae bacterium]|nr:DUF4430 domain-containing protein [Gaiellaceae bacterium]